MSNVTFKCPSCGGYLEFDPSSTRWKCPYCSSSFAEKELIEKDKSYHESAKKEKATGASVVYRCNSCGSEIVTDETTVATHCYYCHSPVVLQGKLTDDMRPEKVLPFSIDKSKAVDRFLSWVEKKRYVPKGFFSREQVESLIQGVYFPYFIYDCSVNGELTGEGKNVDSHRVGNYLETNTHIFHVERKGILNFQNIMRPALSGIRRKITDGIQPYPLGTMKDFSGAYLSGFLAERRNQKSEEYHQDISSEVNQYVRPLLSRDIHYASTNLQQNNQITDLQAKYVLVPAWVITYPNPKKGEEPFYYAMNGCTGAVCGKLPVINKKLWTHAIALAVSIMAIGLLICYFFLNG